MMPAATHFDPVVGVDIHMVQPSGPGAPDADSAPLYRHRVRSLRLPADHRLDGEDQRHAPGDRRHGRQGAAHRISRSAAPSCRRCRRTSTRTSWAARPSQMDGDAAAYMALPCLSCQSIGMPPPPRLEPQEEDKGQVAGPADQRRPADPEGRPGPDRRPAHDLALSPWRPTSWGRSPRRSARPKAFRKGAAASQEGAPARRSAT